MCIYVQHSIKREKDRKRDGGPEILLKYSNKQQNNQIQQKEDHPNELSSFSTNS